MSLTWDNVGERFYEAGVDHGVLYLALGPGVSWNGLISIDDKSTGDSPASYYADGVKFLVVTQPTDFEATIEAYTYPDEFEVCDGTLAVADGLGVTQQPQQEFGLSYRTKVGNDVNGLDLGYKIHLVYRAVATPTEKAYASQNDATDPTTFSWDLTTTPVVVPGFKPSAHLILDSTEMTPFALGIIESILYGFTGAARLPLPPELLALPLNERMIIVIASPTVTLLPTWAKDGDLVFSISDKSAYSVSIAPTSDDREVIVIAEPDVSLLPTTDVYPGDLVYATSTGILYRLGG